MKLNPSVCHVDQDSPNKHSRRMRLNVLIADDSALLRTRLVALISELEDINLVDQTENANETIEAIQHLQPDVVILDIRMPDGGGFQVLNALRTTQTEATVIVLTAFPYPQYRQKCLNLGARYFFDKTTELDQVVETLELLQNKAQQNLNSQ